MEMILAVVLLFLVVCAFFAIIAQTVLDAIIYMSVFSALLAVVFVIMQAPDVAMVEAVIGAGLVTALYVVALNKTEE